MLRAAEVIVFPDPVDAATTAVAQISGAALSVPIVGRVPEVRPKQFVRILSAGGSRETLVSRRQALLVEGWAQTESAAMRLCEIAVATLMAVEGDIFGGVEIASPALLPEPTSTQERATATVEVRVRGTVLA